MAVSAESPSIGRELADIIECSICTEVYTDPRSLPCLHTYCLKCIEQWAQQTEPGEVSECPLCRKEFTVPDGGLSDLPKNFFIEKMKLIKELSSTSIVDQKRVDVTDELGRHITGDVIKMSDGIDSCRDMQKHLTDDKQDFVGRVAKIKHQVCERAEQLKQLVESHKQTMLAELKAIKLTRLQQLDQLNDDIKRHISAMNSLRQYTEELCQKGTANDLSRSTLDLHEKTEALLKFDDFQRAINDLGVIVVTFAPSVIRSPESGETGNLIGRIGAKTYVKTTKAKLPVIPSQSTTSAEPVDIRRAQPHATPVIPSPVQQPSQPATSRRDSDTAVEPTLTHVVPPVGGPVRGVTSLGNKLFVARQRDVAIYDTATFTLQQYMDIDGLNDDIAGLASCATNRCLYVSGFKAIHRIDLGTVRTRLTNWRVDGSPRGLSVNAACNVIITLRPSSFESMAGTTNKLGEYTTHGALVRKINLQSDIAWPRHAVQLTGGQFLVSHGNSDSLNRVCLVDCDGRVVVSYGSRRGSATGQLNDPTRIAVDRNGFVFVADKDNNRIVVLKPSLTWLCDLRVTVDSGLQRPYALCLDESCGRLYIGEDRGERVIVLNNVANQ